VTLASNYEAKSLNYPIDSLVEARAGEVWKVHLQSKDAFGNNCIVGGDDVVAKLQSMAKSTILHRDIVVDRNDGLYLVTYPIPLAGSFLVSIRIDGESVKYCVGPSRERCLLDDEYLRVIRCEQHGVSRTLLDEEGLSGLSNAIVGVETGFLIESHDKFGNLRSGSSTPHLDKSGNRISDAFFVSFAGPSGNTVVTSTAVETLTYFCLLYGGKVAEDIPHKVWCTPKCSKK
jgi:hypothetical protein